MADKLNFSKNFKHFYFYFVLYCICIVRDKYLFLTVKNYIALNFIKAIN